MTQDNIALFHCGGRRNPARSKTALKQFVGTGGVIEKSNCSDGAHSVCVKHQELFRRHSNDDVVSEFVLSYHYMYFRRRLAGKRPKHYLFEGLKGFNLSYKIGRHFNTSLTKVVRLARFQRATFA